jgi:hypothetical protein
VRKKRTCKPSPRCGNPRNARRSPPHRASTQGQHQCSTHTTHPIHAPRRQRWRHAATG